MSYTIEKLYADADADQCLCNVLLGVGKKKRGLNMSLKPAFTRYNVFVNQW